MEEMSVWEAFGIHLEVGRRRLSHLVLPVLLVSLTTVWLMYTGLNHHHAKPVADLSTMPAAANPDLEKGKVLAGWTYRRDDESQGAKVAAVRLNACGARVLDDKTGKHPDIVIRKNMSSLRLVVAFRGFECTIAGTPENNPELFKAQLQHVLYATAAQRILMLEVEQEQKLEKLSGEAKQ